MFCPVDLQYAQQVEAVAQVNGTLYCAAHAVEALNMAASRGPGPSRPVRMGPFSPPAPPQGPTPPPE